MSLHRSVARSPAILLALDSRIEYNTLMTISALAAGICVSAGGVHALSVAPRRSRVARGAAATCRPPKDAPPVSIVQPLCGVESVLARDAALDLRPRLSRLRDRVLPRQRRRSDRSAGARRDRGPSRAARAAADRRRPGQRQPQAQQRGQGLEGGAPRMGDHRRFQRADAARLYPAAARPLAAATPASSARRRSARSPNRSAPRSSAPSSTPTRRAGNMRPRRSASASPRARRCCGGATSWKPAAASRRSAPRSRRTPPRPSSSMRQGLDAHLVNEPFQQPLGARKLKDVWARQLRWARLRRATFPLAFRARNPDDEPGHDRRGGVRRAGIRDEPVGRRRARGGLLVRDRGPARPRRRLAAELAEPARLDGSRPPPARACGREGWPATTSSGAATP